MSRPSPDRLAHSVGGRVGIARLPWVGVTLAVIAAVLHRGWLSTGIISWGDWGYLSPETLTDQFQFPRTWQLSRGLGSPNAALSNAPYNILYGAIGRLGGSYALAERLLTFFPFAVLPFFTFQALARRFGIDDRGRLLAGVLYGANTYIIGIGNQHLLIALVYSLAPLALAWFVDATDDPSRRSAIKVGAVLALGLVLDARIALVVGAMLVGYTACATVATRSVRRPLGALAVAGATVVGLHLYWIVPFALAATSAAFEGVLPTKPFYSWAGLPHALGLNDPFWTGTDWQIFVVKPPSPVLLLLPVVAFAGLLHPRARRDWRLLCFALIGLLAVFLVKGENPPFGGLYTWGFTHVPGLRLFRDMSKFNVAVAVAYSLLIGRQVTRLSDGVSRTRAGRVANGMLAVAALAATLIGAWPWFGQRMQIMHTTTLSPSYRQVNDVIGDDPRWGRVLWIPTEPQFSTRSRLHPSVSATDLFAALNAAGGPGGETRPLELEAALTAFLSGDLDHLLDVYGVHRIVVNKDPAPYPGETMAKRSRWPTLIGEHAAGAVVLDNPSFSVHDRAATVSLVAVRQDAQLQPLAHEEDWRGTLRSTARPLHDGPVTIAMSQRFDPSWVISLMARTASGVRRIDPKAEPGRYDEQTWQVDLPSGTRSMEVELRHRGQPLATTGVALSLLMLIAVAVAVVRLPRMPTRMSDRSVIGEVPMNATAVLLAGGVAATVGAAAAAIYGHDPLTLMTATVAFWFLLAGTGGALVVALVHHRRHVDRPPRR